MTVIIFAQVFQASAMSLSPVFSAVATGFAAAFDSAASASASAAPQVSFGVCSSRRALAPLPPGVAEVFNLDADPVTLPRRPRRTRWDPDEEQEAKKQKHEAALDRLAHIQEYQSQASRHFDLGPQGTIALNAEAAAQTQWSLCAISGCRPLVSVAQQ